MRRLIALLILCLVVATVPAGAADLSQPWPDASDGPPGETLHFPSHSPFTLADVGAGAEADPPTRAVGALYMPEGASAADPVPAVVLLHGAAGVSDAREGTYARQFAVMGVAALVVDAFAARRDMARGFIDRLLNITEAMVLADAYAALRFLDARPEVDGGRVALIGFSYGGMATLYAARAQVAETLAPDGPRFAAHVAFYAPCIAEFADPRTTGAPVLMMWGGRDAIVDPERCAAEAERLRRNGSRVEVRVFDDAMHQWDGAWPGPRTIGRNLAPCRFEVTGTGAVRDARLWLPMWNPLSRKVLLGLCADAEGYLIGRDDGVRADSNAAMAAFLAPVLTR